MSKSKVALFGLVISEAHEGLQAATTARVLNATWQCCRAHFMRNMLAHAGRCDRCLAAAFIATVFVRRDKAAAQARWREVTDQMWPQLPKLAAPTDAAKEDVLASMDLPSVHRVQLHATIPIEQPDDEIKRRSNVVGVVSNQDAIPRLVGAILIEQNDDSAG